MAVPNLETLKCKVIEAFNNLIKRMEKGHPLENYKVIKDSMIAIRYIEKASLNNTQIQTILDHFEFELLRLT